MSNNQRRWRENNPLDSDSNIWDKEDEPVLEGELVNIETNVGPNSSTLYTIKKDDGTELKVWGSTVLDDRFLGVPKGTYVRVTYEGKAKSKKGTYYHNYKVYIDEDSVPSQTAVTSRDEEQEEIKLSDIPF